MKKTLTVSFSALCTLLALGEASQASIVRRCSWNGGPSIESRVTSTPEMLTIQWGNGRITKLRWKAERELQDGSGATWYKMSNSDFLGLWTEDGASRKEIFCR